MRILAGAAAVLAILVTGCTSVVPASPAPALAGTSWVVTALDGTPTLPDYQPTMNFGTAGELNGDNGCNQYVGSYALDGAALTIGQVAQTEMACLDGGRSEQETAFGAALAAVATVRADGENVQLLDAGEQVVLLLAPVPPLTLAGTSWVLGGIVDGSTASAPVEGAPVTLEFTADALSGKACNTFNASYTLAGDTITVGPLATTRMLCNQTGVMEQEALVLDILGGESTVAVNRGVLLVTDPDGRGLQFAKA
ncbi:MAG: META domain-containing protein [Propionicimonas sp.]